MLRRGSVRVATVLLGAVLGSQWLPIRFEVSAQDPSLPGRQVGDTATPDSVTSVQDLGAESTDSASAPAKGSSHVSARQTMRSFIVAIEQKEYRTAVTALDFSSLDPRPDPFTQVRYALRLKACLDRLALVDLAEISDDSTGAPFSFPPGENESFIVLNRGDDGRWRFAADTVAEIDAYYEVLKDKPVIGAEVATAEEAANRDDTDTAPDEPSDVAVVADATEASPPAPPEGLQSARQTMRTLIDAFENREYQQAVAALDFSKLESTDPDIGLYRKQGYAHRLKDVLERMARIDYGLISDDPNAPAFRFPPDLPSRPIEISRGEAGVWRFSAGTVATIDALFEIYKDRPILNLPQEAKPWYARELVLGNETWRLLALFASIFASLVVGQLVRTVLNWRADIHQRRDRAVRSVISTTLAKSAVGIFFLIGLSAGMAGLVLDHRVENLVSNSLHVIFTLVIGYICFRLVDVAVEMLRELARRTGSTLNNMLVPIVSTSLRLTIIVLVVLEIATAVSNQPPSAVLAGLGAGGLAIGLAAQDTIKNLFGSVMIFADRPFELGDRIVIDGHDGPVETVGFRSTRLRTLDGHLVTIPNAEMANKTIRNIGKRPYIRRIMNIRVAYDTPPEKTQLALEILRQLLADHEGKKKEFPARVFLHDFLDSAINIRVLYWFHPPAYWDYCEFSERLNLQVVERFNAEGIRFALPAQRLFFSGDPEKPPGLESDTA